MLLQKLVILSHSHLTRPSPVFPLFLYYEMTDHIFSYCTTVSLLLNKQNDDDDDDDDDDH